MSCLINNPFRLRAYSHQRRAFFSAAEILLRIYQNPMHLNGARWRTTFFRRRTSRCLQNLVRQRVPSKCMGFWYIRSRISAAEKTRVFGVNMPLLITRPWRILVTNIIQIHFQYHNTCIADWQNIHATSTLSISVMADDISSTVINVSVQHVMNCNYWPN